MEKIQDRWQPPWKIQSGGGQRIQRIRKQHRGTGQWLQQSWNHSNKGCHSNTRQWIQGLLRSSCLCQHMSRPVQSPPETLWEIQRRIGRSRQMRPNWNSGWNATRLVFGGGQLRKNTILTVKHGGGSILVRGWCSAKETDPFDTRALALCWCSFNYRNSYRSCRWSPPLWVRGNLWVFLIYLTFDKEPAAPHDVCFSQGSKPKTPTETNNEWIKERQEVRMERREGTELRKDTWLWGRLKKQMWAPWSGSSYNTPSCFRPWLCAALSSKD